MTFPGISLRHLRRRATRSVLTATGVAAAIASLIALVGLSRGAEHAWQSSLLERGTHLLATRKGAVEILSTSLDDRLGIAMRSVAGITGAAGELVDLAELPSGEMATISGWDSASYLWRTLRIEDGSVPSGARDDGIVLGSAMAEAVGKKAGDTLLLSGREFRIAAVCRQESVLTNRSIIMPLAAMQSLLGRAGSVTLFNLRVRNPADVREMSEVKSRLIAAFPEVSFSETGEVADNNLVLRLLRAIAWSTSGIAIAMAAVAVLNTLLMSVMERTEEIGILTAIGWRAERILALVVLEGLALALSGAATGTAAGVAVVGWLARHPRLGGFLQPEITARTLLEIAGAVLLLAAAGSLYPAWRAVRLNPVEAIRKG